MNTEDKINYINSLALDKRISQWEDLILLSNDYLNSQNIEDKLSLNFINCLSGLRSSRFIESDIDIRLLETALQIARKLKGNRKILKGILNDILYYSNFYPEKYNKIELEREINQLNETA